MGGESYVAGVAGVAVAATAVIGAANIAAS